MAAVSGLEGEADRLCVLLVQPVRHLAASSLLELLAVSVLVREMLFFLSPSLSLPLSLSTCFCLCCSLALLVCVSGELGFVKMFKNVLEMRLWELGSVRGLFAVIE